MPELGRRGLGAGRPGRRAAARLDPPSPLRRALVVGALGALGVLGARGAQGSQVGGHLAPSAGVSPGASAGVAGPPVWRVRTAAGGATLLGSVHLLPPTDAWLTPGILADLRRADVVVFETPQGPAAQAAATAAAARWAHLPVGGSLRALLPPAQRSALETLLAADGMPANALDAFAPWFAETQLTISYLTAQGAWAEFGVEAQIMRRAPIRARIQAFETVDDEVRLLAQTPLRAQLETLEDTVRQISSDPEAYGRLVSAYLAGDLAVLNREAVEPLRTRAPGAYARLVVRRNLRWSAGLLKLLRRGGRIFVVVGVGHVVGPDGLPALLRGAGWEVEGP